VKDRTVTIPKPEPVRRPVYAIALPVPVTELGRYTEPLAALYGDELSVSQEYRSMVIWTEGRPCTCLFCARQLSDLTGDDAGPWAIAAICPECRTPDCPQASDHHEMCKDGWKLMFGRHLREEKGAGAAAFTKPPETIVNIPADAARPKFAIPKREPFNPSRNPYKFGPLPKPSIEFHHYAPSCDTTDGRPGTIPGRSA